MIAFPRLVEADNKVTPMVIQVIARIRRWIESEIEIAESRVRRVHAYTCVCVFIRLRR